ncbi:sugar phosphate isomerase/epimerase [Pendulispora brunnea]|uniref:Sugar phosphate isomerase/epimerase n=1 Tax=Pendulispora brunnea TaxID=2905690 RepID=A0ABZ2KG43_9BACT
MPETVLVGLAEWKLPVAGVDAVDLAARLEVDGLQVDLGGTGRGPRLDMPARWRALRAAAKNAGIELLAVTANCLNDIGFHLADRVAEVQSVVLRLLDAAYNLNAPLAFIPSFRRSAMTDTETRRRTIDLLAWACGHAEERDLLLANENVLAPKAAAELVSGVGSHAFRLIFDTGNLVQAKIDVQTLLATVGARIADQIHFKEHESPGSAVACLDVLAKSGFRIGAVVLENDYRTEGTTQLVTDIQAARNLAKKLTQEPS